MSIYVKMDKFPPFLCDELGMSKITNYFIVFRSEMTLISPKTTHQF